MLIFGTIKLNLFFSADAWSFSISELAAPGVEVGRLTATDPDLGENAQLEFTILDAEEADIFNISGREREAVIVLNKVNDEGLAQTQRNHFISLLTYQRCIKATQVTECS